jgi:hypothetical protein
MMKMKNVRLIALIAVILIPVTSLAYSQFATAQSSQSSYTLNLTYLTVQVTYPAQAMPGDSITVNIQASAKKNIDTLSLTAQVYYSDGSSLHQLASTTFDGSNMATGSNFTKQIQFTVPKDTPRTSLVAVLTESVKTSYAAYYYYPVYYNYSLPYCHHDSPYCYYYDYYGYMAYPSYSSAASTDAGLAPLSYVKATTPEYTALQSQDQALQQQLAQSQAQNQQLQQQLQNAQNTNAQKDATISDLNQRLNASQGTSTTYESVAVVLAILAAVLGALAIHFHRGRTSQTTQAKTKPETQPK